MPESASVASILLVLLMVAYAAKKQGDDVGLTLPLSGDKVPQECWNFTFGDREHLEFYSPLYPFNYPNHTECMQIISAPKGYRIRLDFRDDFHIEHSADCLYDMLELRDGPFGYSPLVGKYCGKVHPPVIESSSRFLWIRFKSDDSIEYKGFRAVYEYFRPTVEEDHTSAIGIDEVCRIDVNLTHLDGIISSKQIPEKFVTFANETGGSIDCTWVLYTAARHMVALLWEDFQLILPQECDTNFLEVYDRTTAESHRVKKLCGGKAKPTKTSSNHLYLRLYASDVDALPKFEAVFTVFTKGECNPVTEFECPEKMCINNSLRCNNRQNCLGYDNDESLCNAPVTPTSLASPPLMMQYHVIILGIVGGIIFTVICVSVGLTCRQRKKEERRRQHALKQEGNRASAREMTNLLNRSPHGTGHALPQGPGPGPGVIGLAPPPPGPGINHSARANHVDTITSSQPLSANHVTGMTGGATAAATNNGGPHTLPRRKGSSGSRKSNGHTGQMQTSQTTDFDGSELCDKNNDNGTFRRYLDVGNYPDEDSSPNPSTHREISAMVTVERPPPSPVGLSAAAVPLTVTAGHQRLPQAEAGGGATGGGRLEVVGRDKSPSPRPDVIQEERRPLPEVRVTQSLVPQPRVKDPLAACAAAASASGMTDARRLSVDTVKSDKSDVWKPMTTTDMLQYRPLVLQAAPVAAGGPHSAAQLTNQRMAAANLVQQPPPQHHRLQGEPPPQVPIRGVPLREPPRAKTPPREPPPRAKTPPNKYSPGARRGKKTSQPSPKMKSRTPESSSMAARLAGRAAASKDTPDIFYSRPNRSVTRHHPV